jgi:hypothetical protein
VIDRGIDGGGQQAVDLRLAAAVRDIGKLALVERQPDRADRTVCGEAHRVASKPLRESRDPGEDAVAGAAVRTPADQPDDAPHAPQHVATPGVEGDGKRPVQDDGADVLGISRGVDGHEERAVGVAPQVELVPTQ